MTMTEPTLPGMGATGRARRRDPRPSKAAAALDPKGRGYQRNVLIKYLLQPHVDAITADQAGRLIGRHRSIASSRLGVLKNEGLVEKCGSTPEPDEYGRVREVELYRLTDAGVRDATLMFGGDR